MAHASMVSHLQQSPTFLVPVWKMTSTDGTVAAYTAHTKALSPALLITPANVVGGTFSNNIFTKNASAAWGNSGFSSVESIPGDGYIEYTAASTSVDRVVGLSTTDLNQDYTSIHYGISLSPDLNIRRSVSGVLTIIGTYIVGTVIKVQRTGTSIGYYKDGVALSASAGVSSSPMFADTAVFTASGTIPPIYMSGNVSYVPSAVEATRFSQTLGVTQANNVELIGVFDDTVTEADMQGGKWKNAKIVFEYVAYDPASGAASTSVSGSVAKIKGQAGKFSINNGTYTVEVRSLSDLLKQEIGSLTSPLDRNRRPEDLGVSMAPFTFARTVTAVVDKRNFTVNGAAQVNDYFKYGRVTFTSGANNGLSMEIKASVGNVIELQLPMRSVIAIGNTVSLIAGYDSTRKQTRDKFAAMEAFRGEPDLPGLTKAILTYPE